MSEFRLFDANCQVGRHLHWTPDQPQTRDDLLADLDHFGIDEALVIDSLSRENHPAQGNRRVLETTGGNPRLHPAWAAMPHATPDEQLRGTNLLDEMRKHRVGALFLYPGQYRFTLSDWAVDDFLEPLALAGTPIFVNFNEVGGSMAPDMTDWDAVVALCRRWPTLPVIVSESRIRRGNRLIYRAFDACPNLRVELSAYWLHRGIEFITEHWGAERLVFGSNWPRHGYSDTVATLTTADISDEDKCLIAGDNLRQLISWSGAKHPEVDLPPAADAYVAFGQTGKRPEDLPLFADCHGHMGGEASHYHLPNCTLDGIVRDQRRYGVEKSVIFGFTGVFSDEQPGNDLVAEAVAAHPDLYVGFTLLNPHRGPELMLEELERGKAMGLKGIKLIPHYQGYPNEGAHIDVACKWAHDNRQIILNHYWGGAEQMERLLETYPDACFLTGHMCLSYAALMRKFDNLHVCSCPLIPPGACEHAVAEIGADRLLFGSDLQDLPIAWGLGPILFARISPEDKRLILGDNLRRLLSRYSLV
ncbi:MAG: amidohydrolase family protein [Lentisphaeria bacterium]|nr:amidohydrolase family protein [Lentisphaeria bacterium]